MSLQVDVILSYKIAAVRRSHAKQERGLHCRKLREFLPKEGGLDPAHQTIDQTAV